MAIDPAKSKTEEAAAAKPEKELSWYERNIVKKQKEHGDSPAQIEAEKVVKNFMLWTGAAGLVPMPLVDMAAISALQLTMLHKIAKIYDRDRDREGDVKFTHQWGKQVIGSLTAGIAATSIGTSIGKGVIKSIPVIGGIASVVMVPGFAAASTWALGQVFITHFEGGGTILSFDPVKIRHFYEELFHIKKAELAK